jgi:hypothetical protein
MLPPTELHTHRPRRRAPMPPAKRFCGSCRHVAILTSISTLVLYLARGDVTHDHHGDIAAGGGSPSCLPLRQPDGCGVNQ